MFYRLSAFAIMAGLAAPVVASAQENAPTGIWRDSDQSFIVRIAPCVAVGNAFCGTVLQDNRPGPAANPPNHVLIRGLQRDRRGWRGQINDAGTTLNFTMRMNSPTTALARFCFGIVCDTETWSRVSAANDVGPVSRR
jgi:uncharacterized protein (DUF2147 family)